MLPSHRVTALVVTYNRKTLLARCLQSLLDQSRRVDRILVIDNASTDDTREMLNREFADIEVVTLDANSGGAGGFAAGISYLLQGAGAKEELIWLMDDDAAPKADCLKALLSVADLLGGERWSFLSPEVCSDSEPFDRLGSHRTRPSMLPPQMHLYPDAIPVRWASFVGLLVNGAVAALTWLPYAEFFVWHDDMEYSSRLTGISPGYYIPRAVILHPENKRLPSAERAGLLIRNNLWLFRLARNIPGKVRIRQLINGVSFALLISRKSSSPAIAIKTLMGGLVEGLFRPPVRRAPRDGVTG